MGEGGLCGKRLSLDECIWRNEPQRLFPGVGDRKIRRRSIPKCHWWNDLKVFLSIDCEQTETPL